MQLRSMLFYILNMKIIELLNRTSSTRRVASVKFVNDRDIVFMFRM